MYFYIKMSSVIIVGKILTAYITMAIWIGKQKFSVQKVSSIKLLVTLPKTSSEFHRMTQISHKTKKSPAFVIASFQSRVFFLKNLETICKKGSDAAMVESDLKKNRTSINKKHCVDYLILLHYKIFSSSPMYVQGISVFKISCFSHIRWFVYGRIHLPLNKTLMEP